MKLNVEIRKAPILPRFSSITIKDIKEQQSEQNSEKGKKIPALIYQTL